MEKAWGGLFLIDDGPNNQTVISLPPTVPSRLPMGTLAYFNGVQKRIGGRGGNTPNAYAYSCSYLL